MGADYGGPVISLQFGNLEREGFRNEVGFTRDNINDTVRNHVEGVHLKDGALSAVYTLQSRGRELFTVLGPCVTCKFTRVT